MHLVDWTKLYTLCVSSLSKVFQFYQSIQDTDLYMLEYQSPTELALLLYVFDSKFKSDTTTLFTNDFYNFLHRLAYIDVILS